MKTTKEERAAHGGCVKKNCKCYDVRSVEDIDELRECLRLALFLIDPWRANYPVGLRQRCEAALAEPEVTK